MVIQLTFRFREDPNKEIYTIQPTIFEAQRFRASHGGDGSTSPSIGGPDEQRWNRWKDSGGGWQQDNPSDNPNYDRDSNFQDLTTQLSPNFTKTWEPYFKNSNGTGAINWNPVGDGSPGPIVNGLVLSINHASGPVWNNSGAMWVKVNDLTGTHTDGTKHTITTNMILTSHSDGGKEFEVGNLGLEPLVIRKIIPPTGNATKFKLM